MIFKYKFDLMLEYRRFLNADSNHPHMTAKN